MSERTEKMERYPNARRIEDGGTCEGIKWSQVTLKELYKWGPGRKNEPTGILPKNHCSKQAHWRLTAIKTNDAWARDARSGDYCWQHLVSEITASDTQREHFYEWWESN